MLTLTPIRHRLAPRQTGCGADYADEINLRAARRRRRRSRSAALNRFGTPAPRRPSNRAASLTSHRASLFSLLTSHLSLSTLPTP